MTPEFIKWHFKIGILAVSQVPLEIDSLNFQQMFVLGFTETSQKYFNFFLSDKIIRFLCYQNGHSYAPHVRTHICEFFPALIRTQIAAPAH